MTIVISLLSRFFENTTLIGLRRPQLVVVTYIYDRLINGRNMSAVRAVTTPELVRSIAPLPKYGSPK